MRQTSYRTVGIDGLSIFYREAGRADAPVLLLLHGFPSSSRMYEPLLARLGDAYRLIAPDYPGFGHSDWPDPKAFAYSFDHLAQVMGRFAEVLGLNRYSLFLQDYGGPIGFRLAIAAPERLQALIIQNAVAHEEGLGPLWEARRAFWADRSTHEPALRENFFSLAATRQRHLGRSPCPWLYDPDLWTDEFAFLNRPGQADIQIELFYDYRSNLASYPAWQAWLRRRRPPLLVLWGRHDPSFEVAGAEAYRRDLPEAEVHILEAGHFALDEAAEEVAGLTRDFLGRHVPASASNMLASGSRRKEASMGEAWDYQIRIYFEPEVAAVARRDPGDPMLQPLAAVLARHDTVMKSQYDAFAEYVAEAERNGTAGYPLYAWTKATIEDPAKKAKYLASFTLYAGGREVYPKAAAEALEADLQPLLAAGLIKRLSKHDTNPANNPQPPAQYRS
jgi:pimeloyl-ACP methyl ester carboxylesterase